MFAENFSNNLMNPASIFFSNILGMVTSFQIKDMIDIFVIALIVYALLSLFIKTKSIPIIVGVFSMLLVYALAVFLKLSLTQTVFEYFFGVFLIILIILFQRELRRFFEMVGILGMRGKLVSYCENTIDIITKVVWQFANTKTGALLVFPGRDPIGRHIVGGFYLNGEISEPLLLSIFDKYSPGHDGAVVIEGDKIKNFAVHLPLAEKIDAVRRYGTRHRSALGLSEVTDALCLVVSEERGTVSLAHNRKIEVIENNEKLEKKLKNFFEGITPKKKRNLFKWISANAIPVLVSLGIAVAFWGMFAVKEVSVQKSFTVPVEFQNLSGYVAEKLSTQEVILTLAGDNRDFNLFDVSTLKISLDVSRLELGEHQLLIDKSFIKMPSSFSIVSVDPEKISFRLTEIKPETKIEVLEAVESVE